MMNRRTTTVSIYRGCVSGLERLRAAVLEIAQHVVGEVAEEFREALA